MKKRILTVLLCACLLLIGIPRAEAAVKTLGDANCDGSVTVTDASLILRYTVKLAKISSQGLENADVNWDGSVNAADASAILRYAVKLANLPKSIDSTLLGYVQIGTKSKTSDWTSYAKAITQAIQALPTTDPYRAVLYKAAEYMGTAYASGTFDCSIFVRKAFHESGNSAKYPGGSTDSVIKTFLSKYPQRIHSVTAQSGTSAWKPDTTQWKPGYVLAYINPSTGKGSHISIYIGNINGKDFVMEAASNAGGAYIRELWWSTTDTGTYKLTYYMTPLD